MIDWDQVKIDIENKVGEHGTLFTFVVYQNDTHIFVNGEPDTEQEYMEDTKYVYTFPFQNIETEELREAWLFDLQVEMK